MYTVINNSVILPRQVSASANKMMPRGRANGDLQSSFRYTAKNAVRRVIVAY